MPSSPNDGFEAYFAEKLWAMIPAEYRNRDLDDAGQGVLRSLVKIIAEQAAILRRSHDRLWEDEFIDFCSDWAVPYIGDLVATRMVSALNPRARRVDVAKTIYYRRRAGTLCVLEELICDITGWEGRVVEQFRRLGRTRHGLDPEPGPLGGLFTGTLPGGWADLRNPRGSELVDGPYDEFFHTADVRRHCGVRGRYNIPKLAFYICRLGVFPIDVATPATVDGKGFTFDPSGRDVPLFIPRARNTPERHTDWNQWRSAEEWQLPGPLKCRVLSASLAGRWNDARLWPDALSVTSEPAVGQNEVAAGCLAGWTPPPGSNRLVVDPERGRFLFTDSSVPVSVSYHYGFSGCIGAGTYARQDVGRVKADKHVPPGGGPIAAQGIENAGVTEISDSATYGPVGNKTQVRSMTLQAANQQRPFLKLASDWSLGTGSNSDASLALDGLWVGGTGSVILTGDYREVVVRHLTLDPGGAPGIDGSGTPLPAVPLVIRADIAELRIESSVTGPITVESGEVEKLVIRDSIIQSSDGTKPALNIGTGDTYLERVTVFGSASIHRLWATETIITGATNVVDTQRGCFRFSASLADALFGLALSVTMRQALDRRETPVEIKQQFGPAPYHNFTVLVERPGELWVIYDVDARRVFRAIADGGQLRVFEIGRLPHPYQSYFAENLECLSSSRRFGDPNYGQLSAAAPHELLRGAQNGSEMGAFSSLLNPTKLDSLAAKVAEYAPAGLIPIWIFNDRPRRSGYGNW